MKNLIRQEWRSVVNTFFVTPLFLVFGLWALYALHGWQLYVSCVILGTVSPFLIFNDFLNEDRDLFSSAMPPDPIEYMRNRTMFFGYLWLMRFMYTPTMLVAGCLEAYQDMTWLLSIGFGFVLGLANAWFVERFHFNWSFERSIYRSSWDDERARSNDQELRRRRDLDGYRREIDSMERAIVTYDELLTDTNLNDTHRSRLKENKEKTLLRLNHERKWMEKRRVANY